MATSHSLPEIKHDALEDPSLRPVIVIRKKGVFQCHRKMLGQRTYLSVDQRGGIEDKEVTSTSNMEVHSHKTAD